MWILPSTLRASVPAVVASIGESAEPWLVLEQSFLWRGKPSLAPLWQRRWKQRSWLRRLSGLTYSASTAAPGVAEFIASLPGTRARVNLWPGSVWVPRTSDGSGQRSLGSFARSTRSGCSWKMSRAICPRDCGKSSATYKRWATGLRRDFSERAKSEQVTPGSESSSWPTPDATVSTGYQKSASPNASIRPHLGSSVKTWPTPRASESENRTTKHQPSVTDGRGHGRALAATASVWPTPNVPNGGRVMSPADVLAKGATEAGKRQVGLESVARLWPTPMGSEGESGSPGARHHMRDLRLTGIAVGRQWPTPVRADSERNSGTYYRGNPTLPGAISKWPTPRGSDGEKGGPHSRDSSGSVHLASMAVRTLWATPLSRDFRSPAVSEETRTKNSRPLSEQVGRWPTPTAQDAASSGAALYPRTETRNTGTTLTDAAVRLRTWPHEDGLESSPSRPDPTTTQDGEPTSTDGGGAHQPLPVVLNPYFVEALMGWPQGSTDPDLLHEYAAGLPPFSTGATGSTA